MNTPSPSRTQFFALFSSILAITALAGCSIGAPAPINTSTPVATNSAGSQSPDPSAASASREAKTDSNTATGRLDPATEDLSWTNGNRIIGDENGGHTPDIASSLTDPAAGWEADYSRMATDGMMTFSSGNTRCKVRTVQARNNPAELVAGDDKASTQEILAILFPGKTDLMANAKDATLGYGIGGSHEVDMLAVTYTSGDAYGYTAVRTFNKPAVTVRVEALCPTLDTLKATLPEISKSISINAR